MLSKGNVNIGLEWRFGPDWRGQRCGAKTRQGTGCQRPANKKNGRCRLHGGASTGAKTSEGRKRISQANMRHGKYTKEKLEKQRMNAALGRATAARLDKRLFHIPSIEAGIWNICILHFKQCRAWVCIF